MRSHYNKPTPELRDLARKYNAVIIKNMTEAKNHRTEHVAFETQNFGYVLSPVDPSTGTRRILARE